MTLTYLQKKTLIEFCNKKINEYDERRLFGTLSQEQCESNIRYLLEIIKELTE